MSFTLKQQRFVEEYLIDLNATQAAIRAGYSEKTASSQGERLLRNVEIAAAIKKAIDKRAEITGLTALKVLNDLEQLLDMCMGRIPVRTTVINKVDGNSTPIEVEIKAFEPVAAKGVLELLGKHLKMFTEKIEQSGPNGGPVQHQVTHSWDAIRAKIAQQR